jgi:hypothetical protein
MAHGPEESILPRPAMLAATVAVTVVAWSMAAWLWSSGNRAFAVSLFLSGLSLGPGLVSYLTAPRALKQRQRRLVLLSGGLGILAPSLLAATSLDPESFVLLLFAGTALLATRSSP